MFQVLTVTELSGSFDSLHWSWVCNALPFYMHNSETLSLNISINVEFIPKFSAYF